MSGEFSFPYRTISLLVGIVAVLVVVASPRRARAKGKAKQLRLTVERLRRHSVITTLGVTYLCVCRLVFAGSLVPSQASSMRLNILRNS